MDTIEHLFVCANEEGLEVGMAASKILRFGQEMVWPDDSPTSNLQDFVQEVNDLMGVLECMQEHGVVLDGLYDRDAIEAKKKKIEHYMGFSHEKGTLQHTQSPIGVAKASL